MKIKFLFIFISSIVFHLMLVTRMLGQDGPHSNELPHPVNAPMGIPDPIGSLNIRLNAIHQNNIDNSSVGDLGGHISYGLSDIGGLHLRSLGVRTTPFTELIGMISLWRDAAMKQGISFIGILGVPTGKKDGDAHHGLSYLAGIAGRITLGTSMNNDAVLHYDFTARHYIAESGTVLRLLPNIFAVLDTKTTIGNSLPEVLVMPSLKFSLFSQGFLGIGYNVPLANGSAINHQAFVQFDIGSH